MKKVELLAPAGSFESFRGAVHAGADAVYIGGSKFGARAYAGNFTGEEVCLAIRYAHLYGRKLYLTVNTLVKEAEMEEIPSYIKPFYEEGLDGVIVQDVGVLSLLREYFPQMKLHGSTQMNVTGPWGAQFLLEQGVSRVVPARELSLRELCAIKETGIEVEAFIHGAMCYCYSGQCLFSSMLGGRSGNRGRCAQPCRLPYQTADGIKTPPHPLSLKDMCTLPFLPELIRAGIDSFKIEGRMKRPEYAAGVTAVYRRYIDRYYENPDGEFTVLREDRERLQSLYIRSEIQTGYYYRHNGAEMITPGQPGYGKCDETYLQEIRADYLEHMPKIAADGEALLQKGKPAVLHLRAGQATLCEPGVQAAAGKPGADDTGCGVTVRGQEVQSAQKQPLTEEAVRKQLVRTGNTPFIWQNLTIRMDENAFLPVRALNDLRREAFAALENAILQPYRRTCAMPAADADMAAGTQAGGNASFPYLAVQTEDDAQLAAVLDCEEIDRLYIGGDFVTADMGEEWQARLVSWKAARPDRSLFLVMPRILRLRDAAYLTITKQVLFSEDTIWDGVLVRNAESLYWLRQAGYTGAIQADAGLYAWNRRARAFWTKTGASATAPLECSKAELHKMGLAGMEVIVYGRSPLMVTANCIRRTGGRCPAQRRKDGKHGSAPAGDELLWLQDRYRTRFPVRTVCAHCYNEIYNSVPLSLHEYGNSLMRECPAGIRLCFTTEDGAGIRQVLNCYRHFIKNPGKAVSAEFPGTKGLYKRGAE